MRVIFAVHGVRGATTLFPNMLLGEELAGGQVEGWGNREICLKNPKSFDLAQDPAEGILSNVEGQT